MDSDDSDEELFFPPPVLQQLLRADPTRSKADYWIDAEGWDTEKAQADYYVLQQPPSPLLQQLWEADPTVNKCEYWISGEGWDTEKAREDWNALLLELEYWLHAEGRDTEKVPPPQIQWLLTADPSFLAGSGGEALLLDVLEPCLSEESVSGGALVTQVHQEQEMSHFGRSSLFPAGFEHPIDASVVRVHDLRFFQNNVQDGRCCKK